MILGNLLHLLHYKPICAFNPFLTTLLILIHYVTEDLVIEEREVIRQFLNHPCLVSHNCPFILVIIIARLFRGYLHYTKAPCI